MEPLSAIALAGNLLQFIEIGTKIIKRLYDFQESRGEAPKIFRGISVRLPLLVQDLKRCKDETLRDDTADALTPVLNNCRSQLQALNNILDETLPTKNDSWATKNRKALLSIRKEKEIDRIDNDLRSCIELLTFHHVLPERALTLHKVDSGLTLVASPAGVKCEFFEVPRKQVSHFVGREAIIEQIQKSFQDSGSVVLQGMGGQGKTQIALEYCRRSRESRAYAGIFWMDAASEIQLRRSFDAVAETIKPPNRVLENTEQRIAFVKHTLETTIYPWLLVLDNHDDPVNFPRVADFLPSTQYGHVLFTTRHIDVCRYGSPIELATMSEDEALDLFFHRAQWQKTESDVEHAKQIVKRLGYHPLALDQAAAYFSKRKRTLKLENFVEHYKKRKKDILKSTPKVWEYQKDLDEAGHKISLSVFTTWELSFDRLVEDSEHGEESAALLSLLAYFHHGDISESIFAAFWDANKDSISEPSWIKAFTDGEQWDADAFQDALVELCDMGLIESQYKDQSDNIHISLHPLVKDWIQIRAAAEARYEHSIQQAQIFLNYLLSVHDDSFYWFSVQDAQAAYSHLAAMEENYHDFIQPNARREHWELLADMYNTAARFLDYNGRYKEAEKLLDRAMDWRLQIDDATSEKVLLSKSWKARNLMHQARYQEAEAISREVEAAYASQSSGDTSNRVRNLIYIAEVLSDQGKDAEAEDLYRTVITRSNTTLGREHALTIMALNNLAIVLRERSKFAEAEEISRDLILLRQKQYGDDHLHTLIHYGNLAIVLTDVGKFKEAERINRRCLAVRSNTDGVEHPRTLNSASNLSFVLNQLGCYKDAEDVSRNTLAKAENVFGQGHPMAVHTLDNLATALLHQGKLSGALEAAKRALASREKALGQTHPHTLRSANTLGNVLLAQGENREAERIFLEVLDHRKRILGGHSVFTLVTCHNLAMAYKNLGKVNDARELFQSTLERRSEILGRDHPHTWETAVEYALLLQSPIGKTEAKQLLQNAAVSLQYSLNEEHPIHRTILDAIESLNKDSGV